MELKEFFKLIYISFILPKVCIFRGHKYVKSSFAHHSQNGRIRFNYYCKRCGVRKESEEMKEKAKKPKEFPDA